MKRERRRSPRNLHPEKCHRREIKISQPICKSSCSSRTDNALRQQVPIADYPKRGVESSIISTAFPSQLESIRPAALDESLWKESPKFKAQNPLAILKQRIKSSSDLLKTRKRRGPKTLPWETPLTIGNSSEKALPNFTRKECPHHKSSKPI